MDPKQFLCDHYQITVAQLTKLEEFVQAVITYNQAYNIIGKTTIETIWQRHIIDSAQLIRFIEPTPTNNKLIDLGSGAGFPGIVLAIMGIESITLIEKSVRKSEFLQSIINHLQLNVRLYCNTLAEVATMQLGTFDYLTARAFAPLQRLIPDSLTFLASGSLAILPKGRTYNTEIQTTQPQLQQYFSLQTFPSITAEDSRILVLKRK